MDKTLSDTYFSQASNTARENDLRNAGFSDYLDSFFLQRLKGISFLGVLDYVYDLKCPSDRYNHTICVSHLALGLSRQLGLPEDDERAFVIANLIHDTGHAAFSHNSEPFLLQRLKLYHQGLLAALYTRSKRFGKNEISLASIVNSEPSHIATLVTDLILKSREAAQPLQALFESPLNCDKIEGNHRTLSHLGLDSIPPQILLDLYIIKDRNIFVSTSGLSLIVDFWKKERDVYWNNIYTSAVFSAEAMLTRSLELYFQENKQPDSIAFMTDREAVDVILEYPKAAKLVQRVMDNRLYSSMYETRPAIYNEFKPRFIESRFDIITREVLEREVASVLGVPSDQVISHFSRRKHFDSRFGDLSQMNLFDDYTDRWELERVVNAFKNSKRSGDYFELFWSE